MVGYFDAIVGVGVFVINITVKHVIQLTGMFAVFNTMPFNLLRQLYCLPASSGIQMDGTHVEVEECGTQCDLLNAPPLSTWLTKADLPQCSSDTSDSEEESGGSDCEYDPRMSECDSSDSDVDMEPEVIQPIDPINNEDNHNKYIIFWSSLRKLLTWCHCPECGSQDIQCRIQSVGTFLCVTVVCGSCHKQTQWDSQPHIGNFPAGNILLSAGILFSGASVSKVLRVLNSIGIVTYNKRTFFRHQKFLLIPAIEKVWETQQDRYLSVLRLEDRALVLGGDGRADSPGHSAKYGTYTVMELDCNLILDIKQVQVCDNVQREIHHVRDVIVFTF